MAYNTAVIRELLTAAFDDEKLTIFCYDHFRPVYESFAKGWSKTQKVQALIDYCDRNNQFPRLLSRVRTANLAKYAEFEAKLDVPSQALSAPSTVPAHALPERQRRSTSEFQDRNPFRYLRPVSPDEFLGRWPLVKEMAWDLALDNGDSHACIGGRRFGKSSLLLALHHYLCQPEAQKGDHSVLPILFDFKEHHFESEAAFFATVLQEVRKRVDVDHPSYPSDPSPVKVPLNQAWLDSLPTGDPPGLSLSRFKEAIGHILNELYRAGGPTRLVLLLDEVDNILSYKWRQHLFDQLRSLVYIGDMKDRARLVMAGSRRFLDEASDSGSPLWNVLKIHYLMAFDETTTYQLIERFEDLDKAAQQAVWQQSGGHPFLAQYLLHHLWEKGVEQAGETIVAQVANRFLHEEQAHLDGWARALGETGLEVYGHLVDQPGWVDEMDLIRVMNVEGTLVHRALVDLCYHGFIVHDGEWQRYHRTGDLLRNWYVQRGRSHSGTSLADDLAEESQLAGMDQVNAGEGSAVDSGNAASSTRQQARDGAIQIGQARDVYIGSSTRAVGDQAESDDSARATPDKVRSLSPGLITISVLAALILGFVSNILANMMEVNSPQSFLIAVGVFGLALAISLWVELRMQYVPLIGLYLLAVRISAGIGVLCLVGGMVWSLGVSLHPSPVTEPIPTSAIQLTPTPRKTDEALLYDDFSSKTYWTESRNDPDGRAWYSDGTYNLLSRSTKRGWIWVMPRKMRQSDFEKIFTDVIIEVDVTLITDERVTGYGLVAGWEEGNNYYLFDVRPGGDCSFLKFESHKVVTESYIYSCPPPIQDKIVRVRLEVQDGHMIAFVDDQFVAQHTFADYHGGLVGFEAYNHGEAASGLEAQVQFDDLVIWDVP